MQPIRNIIDIENLKADEPLVQCVNGIVKYYRFLCFHPHNRKYVILLDGMGLPERFYCEKMIEKFFVNFNDRDIISYRINHTTKLLNQLQQAALEAAGQLKVKTL